MKVRAIFRAAQSIMSQNDGRRRLHPPRLVDAERVGGTTIIQVQLIYLERDLSESALQTQGFNVFEMITDYRMNWEYSEYDIGRTNRGNDLPIGPTTRHWPHVYIATTFFSGTVALSSPRSTPLNSQDLTSLKEQ